MNISKRLVSIFLALFICFSSVTAPYSYAMGIPIPMPNEANKEIIIKILQKLLVAGAATGLYESQKGSELPQEIIDKFWEIDHAVYEKLDAGSKTIALQIHNLIASGKATAADIISARSLDSSSVFKDSMITTLPKMTSFGVSKLPSAKQTAFTISNGDLTITIKRQYQNLTPYCDLQNIRGLSFRYYEARGLSIMQTSASNSLTDSFRGNDTLTFSRQIYDKGNNPLLPESLTLDLGGYREYMSGYRDVAYVLSREVQAVFSVIGTAGWQLYDVDGRAWQKDVADSVPSVKVKTMGVSASYFDPDVPVASISGYWKPDGGSIAVSKDGTIDFVGAVPGVGTIDQYFNPGVLEKERERFKTQYPWAYPGTTDPTKPVDPSNPTSPDVLREKVKEGVDQGITTALPRIREGVREDVQTGVVTALPKIREGVREEIDIGVKEGVREGIKTGIASGIVDWIAQLIKELKALLVGLATDFIELLKELFITLFVPKADYFSSWNNRLKINLDKRLGYSTLISTLDNLKDVNSQTPSVTANFGSGDLQFIDFSFINSPMVREFMEFVVKGTFFFLLLIYNINNIYRIIRGTNLVSIGKTIENFNGRDGD